MTNGFLIQCREATTRQARRSEERKEFKGGDFKMAKKSRGGRMTAAKKRAAKKSGGRGAIKKRAAGRNIMKT
jgi:hypothetical protein